MAQLTKSRFKLGLQCATKLYYDSFRKEYHNKSAGDSFLQALAEGGFQVGELAKMMYPGGIDIDTLDRTEAIRLTEEALKQDRVIIYEAAIQVGHKLIRVDILKKTPQGIQLIEVKSKSCEGANEAQFFNKDGLSISSGWKPYLEDVIFQYIVMKEYLAEKGSPLPVFPYLMCSDKEKYASVDGLHSLFRIQERNGRKTCIPREGITQEDLGDEILTAIRLKDAVDAILHYDYGAEHPAWDVSRFEEIIPHFEQLLLSYEAGGGPWSEPMCKTCKSCEFRLDDSPESQGKKSGFDTCGKSKGWSEEQLNAPKVYDVWSYAASKDRIAEERWFMSELNESDVETKSTPWTPPEQGEGLSTVQRKYIQVEQTCSDDPQPYVDVEGLREAMEEVTYPLHFIDFETAAPAIPFFKDYRPYKGLCFQFSHHIMEKDGTVRHASEYLGLGQGEDPSWGFIEALYEALRHDEGTIFRYASHENTYLGYVRQALEVRSPFDTDKTQQLIAFIRSITQPTGSIPEQERWEVGSRNMVDLCKMVKHYYWHPRMGGSNSIKYVLPAILEHSTALQKKYGQAIYGSDSIPSLNFKDKTWVQHDEEGKLSDPYSLLPPVLKDFGDMQQEQEEIYVDGQLVNGGAAMTAWAYMQMVEMSDGERHGLAEALKAYCELDTLAMVMIWEGWKECIAS